jgi:dTDP-4-dehydrorhamnose 3,5-epimerase
MIFTETPLEGAFVIDLEKRGDDRGFFARVFCEREFADHGLVTHFKQVNNSLSAERGTLRGMHYQLPPMAETKLVRCVRGSLFDQVIDLRDGSETFGESFGVELSAENRRMLYVPKGFAHGFLTLAEDTEAFYLVDEFYGPELERGIRYDDPRFSLSWPIEPAVVSEKDRGHPDFDPAHHLA